MEHVQCVGDLDLSLYSLIYCLSGTKVSAAGRVLGVNENNLAGEESKAAEEEGMRAISKAGTSVGFVLCLGLLMNTYVIAGPAFVTLQLLGGI